MIVRRNEHGGIFGKLSGRWYLFQSAYLICTKENEIFEKEGLDAYSTYQIEHEDDVLKPGSGFALVKALLHLNTLSQQRLVEVIIMSRNSADTSLRVFRSIEHYGLDITRAVLSGGESLANYLESFGVDSVLVGR